MGLSLGSQMALVLGGQSGGVGLRSLFAGGYTGFLFEAMTTSILFQDTAATTPVAIDNDPVARANDQSGNGANATNATGTQRPFWKPNSGKPYLLPDRVDDRLVTAFVPTTAVTLACAVRFSAGVDEIVMGGGVSTGSHRCFIAHITSTGQITVGWGSETLGSGTYGPDLGVTDHVVLITGDAVSRDLWIDGILVNSIAPVGGFGPDGTGGGVALGVYNNNGTPSTFFGGRLYAALGISRRVTPSEVARITTQFQRTYQ